MGAGKSTMYDDLSEILYTEEQIREAVTDMGRRIAEDYRGKEPVMVCILKGASMFFCDLIRAIGLPLKTEYVILSSYQNGVTSTGRVKISKDLDENVEGKDVLIVEDIVDTGLTLDTFKKTLEVRKAASVKIVTFLNKPQHRTADLFADYVCFDIPDAFVVGYGLDYAEKYRNLPVVGILDPKIYK